MKQKTLYFLLATLLITSSILSCNKPELMPDPVEFGTPIFYVDDTSKVKKDFGIKEIKGKAEVVNQIVVGTTTYIAKGVKLPGSPLNLEFAKNLKNNKDPDLKGKPLKYLAVGGSLAAGVRDGGYFNEGMITSYPNLIARQLGIMDFKMPLFDAQDYNGTGRKIPTNENITKGPFQKFLLSDNNLGIQETYDQVIDVFDEKLGKTVKITEKKLRLKPYKGFEDDLDVFAYPNQTLEFIHFTNNGDQNSKMYKDRIPMKEKFITENRPVLYQSFSNKKADLVTIEMGTSGFTSGITYYGGLPMGAEHPLRELVEKHLKAGSMVCIANIPDFTRFPFYTQITMKDVKNAVYNTSLPGLGNLNDNATGFIPNSSVDSLLSPIVSISLKPLNAFNDSNITKNFKSSKKEVIVYQNQNLLVYDFRNLNVPIVDMFSIFNSIIDGKYITHDGVQVDPSLKGNFFSNDGLYPTPFGNAVIANEFIKTINTYYKKNIPLLATREFLGIK